MEAGTRLGPYEVVSLLGAGGMGEVYRAKDTRLDRIVALKVLASHSPISPEARQRFEREARTVSSLNHPNICILYDVGQQDGTAFLVMEYIDGETLHSRLKKGPLPIAEALRYAIQIADALDKAHRNGIVHRDLKPGNIMLSKSVVKLLDFGLAKVQIEAPGASELSVLSTLQKDLTSEGLLLGTLPYMAPEQLEGKSADPRTDIFAFGALIYEMIIGQRAFPNNNQASLIASILKEDPSSISAFQSMVPAALERLVRRCLAKDPDQRWQCAGDLCQELRWVADSLEQAATGEFVPRGRERVLFKQKTFRKQAIFSARIAPDGRTILFSASTGGNDNQIFIVRPEYPEPSAIGPHHAHLLSISSRNELAILTNARWIAHRVFLGTLARVPLGGGAPREILENVQDADWSPDGLQLAIIREVAGKYRLEYPIGNVLFETTGYISDLRISRTGDRIAYLEHPNRNYDDRGAVSVIELNGRRFQLGDKYWGRGLEGLAWSADGKEIVYSAAIDTGRTYRILVVDLNGSVRQPLQAPGTLTIQDISSEGHWLATSDEEPLRIMVRAPGTAEEQDLSWLDCSLNGRISNDGRFLLFTDQNTDAGEHYMVGFRKTDGSPMIHLGEGTARGLSPDGSWALATIASTPNQLMLYPTGPGGSRRVDHGELETYNDAAWIGDGRSLFVCGNEPDRAFRFYLQSLDDNTLKPVTPEGVIGGIAAPDGARAVVQLASGSYLMCDLTNGETRPLAFMNPEDQLVRWSPDGKRIWVFLRNRIPIRVEQVDPESGLRETLTEIVPRETTGVQRIVSISLADDPNVYAYTSWDYSSRLFLIQGAT